MKKLIVIDKKTGKKKIVNIPTYESHQVAYDSATGGGMVSGSLPPGP